MIISRRRYIIRPSAITRARTMPRFGGVSQDIIIIYQNSKLYVSVYAAKRLRYFASRLRVFLFFIHLFICFCCCYCCPAYYKTISSAGPRPSLARFKTILGEKFPMRGPPVHSCCRSKKFRKIKNVYTV